MATTVYTELPPNAPCSYRTSRKSKLGRRWIRERNIGPGRNRLSCGSSATRLIDGIPFCQEHNGLGGSDRKKKRPSKNSGSSKHQIDPYYDSAAWRELRKRTLQRDNNLCRYCGVIAHQADHVIPRRKGGTDDLSNLVACCGTCNKTAMNNRFPSFDEKKAWVLANRPKEEERPKVLLERWQYDLRKMEKEQRL